MASGMWTALKGRTHGCYDQRCIELKILDNPEPFTHGPDNPVGCGQRLSALPGSFRRPLVQLWPKHRRPQCLSI